MRVYDILSKKRDNKEVSEAEIDFIIRNYVQGNVPDYQMSAFLMAAYINGLNKKELTSLTKSMINSGDTLDLSGIPGIKVDKHSTGGVGDKTTLVLAPLMASVGVPFAKMSGRGLGHTGGTLDKLEAIPGFSVNLSVEEFVEQVKRIGVAVIGASDKIVPADKKLYALRDVTATVSSIPLIASSIVSKKIAGGADAIVLDVKCGSGAFLKSLDEAKRLAKLMIDILHDMGKKAAAVISNMDQPLGFAVGNALEVEEAINALKGDAPPDLEELCLELGAQMLLLAGKAADENEAKEMLQSAIISGNALAKLEEFILSQGGNSGCLESTRILPQAQFINEFKADESGYITGIDAEKLGLAAIELGAGRKKKEDTIDPAAGLVLSEKIGDFVEKGDCLVEIHAGTNARIEEIEKMIKESFTLEPVKPKDQKMVYGIIKD